MRYITNVYIKIKPLRMRYFLQLVHLYGKKAGNYNNKKERRKYPAIHINVPPIRSHNPPFHQICHIQMVYQATEMDK